MAYAGKILLDGTELRTVSPESLYETVSVIQQNVFVFNASIRDNVTMFRSFPPEELAQAVRRAQLEALLAERGEDYLCGENGQRPLRRREAAHLYCAKSSQARVCFAG